MLRFLRRFRSQTPNLVVAHRSLEETQNYWRHPDHDNQASAYLSGMERSQYLASLIRAHTGPNASILEIGCNVGRNLDHLRETGFQRLAGIEINADAIRLMRQSYPALTSRLTIYGDAVESVLPGLPDSAYDTVFTMAVLEHIHTDSEWIFSEIVRICERRLITVEDETGQSWRHFPRNYRYVFEGLGMKQVAEDACGGKVVGLYGAFKARVFART